MSITELIGLWNQLGYDVLFTTQPSSVNMVKCEIVAGFANNLQHEYRLMLMGEDTDEELAKWLYDCLAAMLYRLKEKHFGEVASNESQVKRD